MTQAFEHIIDIISAIIIIFIFPLLYFGQKQDALIQTLVSIDTSSFMEEIRGKGYLTADMYDSFMGGLAKTGLLYDVDMKLKQEINEPEYRLRTLDEVIDEQNNNFTGPNVYHYYPVSTEIPAVTEPDSSGLTMNDETNESVLAGATGTPAAPGHVHTAACYAGHVHTGTQTFTHSHTHTASCRRYESAIMYDVTCRSCGQSYQWTAARYYWDNGLKNIFVDTYGINQCFNCNSRSIMVSNPIYDYGYSCYYTIDENGDGFTDEVPVGVLKIYPGYSNPQSDDRVTYTSGCYTYHNSKTYESLLEYAPYTGYITNGPQVYNMLVQAQFRGFCTIPRTYVIKYLSDEDDPNSWSRYLVYTAQYLPNGSVQFLFSYYYDNGWPAGNPGFPAVLDVTGLQNISFKYGFNEAWRIATGRTYSTGTWATVEVEYSGSVPTCGFDHSLGVDRWIPTCGQVEDKRIVCNQKVIGIVPTHPEQAVYTGEPLITTVTATYLDGSSKVVLATTTFQTANPVSDKMVTLEYTDTTGQKVICTIKISVIPRRKTCVNGHTYNLNNDGSDPGCPYCRAWLRSLSITFPPTSSITIYKGTSLADNGIELLATYMDGHTEKVIYGYVDNLDQTYVGIQYVTISYKGKNVTLTVITKRNLTQCPVCHRFYELYPDGTDPGCPYCAAHTPIFTGNVMRYYNEKYTYEILKELYEGRGTFYFTDKDYLTFKISSRVKGTGGNLLSHIFHDLEDDGIGVISSGYIRENGK